MRDIACVLLAAGKGVRMKSNIPKALCELSGRAMVEYLIEIAKGCGIKDIVVVGGYKIDMLRRRLKDYGLTIIEQKKLLGSADAVKQAESRFRGFKGTLLVLYADTPLIKLDTIKAMLRSHLTSKASLTLLTGITNTPKDYGRVLRDEEGKICSIVEHTDVKASETCARKTPDTSTEINTGAYCFDAAKLFEGLRHIRKNRIKKEFYLTDIISYFYNSGYYIKNYATSDDSEMLGINRREDLIVAEEILRRRTISRLIEDGIEIKDPETAYIQEGVQIGKGTTILPFVMIEKGVRIGKNCRIGPFANLRRGTVLKDNSEIGNFVEVVRSTVGNGSKAKHLSYLGDTSIGKSVNIGAGTITANYDGKKKNKTIIDDKAFIGSGTTIVAPVKIGRKAMTGAGSVVVRGRDIPPETVVVGIPARPLRSLKKNKGG